MNTRTTFFFLLAILCLALSTVSAQVLFTSGPINGNLNADYIDGPGGPFGQSISDGFVATATGFADTLNFGEWTLSGAPTTIQWAIGSTSFGGTLSDPTAVTSTFLGINSYGYGLYNTQLSIHGVYLGAGITYYLTLSGANDAGGTQFDAWDENDSPNASCYYESPIGSGPCMGPYDGSESFTISTSNTTSTTCSCCGGEHGISCIPEPNTIMLFGAGMLGFAGMLLRKLHL